jgi:hypothetical protein
MRRAYRFEARGLKSGGRIRKKFFSLFKDGEKKTS